MTSNLRSRGGGSVRRPLDPEEQFQRRVTLGFIGLIAVAIVVILIGLIWQYWDQHLKAVATVDGTAISRDQWTDRARLEDFRLERAARQVTEAAAAGDLTTEQADARSQAIQAAQETVADDSIESLIDLTLKSKLAAERGITVTDGDVDAAIALDGQRPETRRVSVIEIAPDTLTEPTSEDRRQALADAQAAQAALEAGTPFEEVARQYSTGDDAADGGDRGTIGRDDTTLDPALVRALFSIGEGEDTPLLQDEAGTYQIGRVTAIRPATDDPGFRGDLEERVSFGAYRENVRLETIAQRLEDGVVADATTGDKPQVHLAEVWLSGDPEADPADDSGRIHAAHILYSPADDPGGAADLPGTDPSWMVAQAQAGVTAGQLTAITDLDTRADAFTELARQGDDSTATEGGDLGWFDRGTMVPEFADPLFDNVDTLQVGDIVGPVRSDFGYHVIQFLGFEPPLAQRLTRLTDALAAPDADFAAIAADLSDGAEAADGGDLGWRLVSRLPAEAVAAIGELEVGGTTTPIPTGDGYHVYRLIDRADRPLDPAQLAQVSAGAFDEWYQPQKDAAEDDGRITRDDSIFEGL
jgi:parvulin-like peptidyl-prolyl isomerase